MSLQRGEILGYDFNRMVVDFTMLNQGKTVRCAISTAAMDNLEGSMSRMRFRPNPSRSNYLPRNGGRKKRMRAND